MLVVTSGATLPSSLAQALLDSLTALDGTPEQEKLARAA
jgi:hypothetical protein